MQKQLQLRMDMAVFLQDTVKEMAKDIRSQHDGGADKSVNNLLKLLEDVGASSTVAASLSPALIPTSMEAWAALLCRRRCCCCCCCCFL